MKKGFLSKNFIFTMIIAILVVIFGIFISIQSQSFLSVLILLFGIASVINGIREFILVAKFSEYKSTRFTTIVSGITSIVVGVIIIVYPFISQRLVTIIVLYMVALQLIISALARIIASFTVKRNKLEGFTLSLIPAVFNISVALLFILFPTQIANFFVRIVGFIIITYGLGLFFWAFRMRKVEKDFKNQEITGDAEIIE